MFNKEDIFSSFSVNNIEEARQFYKEVLGLEVKENPMGILELVIPDSNHILIYPKKQRRPAEFTVLNIPVKDIDEAVDTLIHKGISFEEYEGEIQTDSRGISRANDKGPDIAWFKDPSGNIISVLAL